MAGRRMDDYGGWPHDSDMSMASKTHLKRYHGAEGAGRLHDGEYHDTEESIVKDQEHGDAKASSRGLKPGYRN